VVCSGNTTSAAEMSSRDQMEDDLDHMLRFLCGVCRGNLDGDFMALERTSPCISLRVSGDRCRIVRGLIKCWDVKTQWHLLFPDADSRRAAAFLRRSTSHLPKASSSGLLGKLQLPFSTNTRLFFLPIACLAAPAIDRHYHAIMHAKPSPRKPRAMKQILAWLVRASFLIKHGEWTPCRTIRVK
jgi:hypothetical protein